MGTDNPSDNAVLEDHEILSTLCQAMFIEGARVLGYALHSPMPREAQEKVHLAASLLVERLQSLLELQGDDSDPEWDFTED